MSKGRRIKGSPEFERTWILVLSSDVEEFGLIGVVIVANGNLAGEMLSCLEQILGQQRGFTAVALNGEYDLQAKQDEICRAVVEVDDGEGVIVVTDIFGSSPANLSRKACCGSDRIILCGANLPMLVKLAKSRKSDLQRAAVLAADAGRKYVQVIE